METVFDALKAMGKATSVELAARLDISREEVLNELWELKKAGFVDKSVYTWRVAGEGESGVAEEQPAQSEVQDVLTREVERKVTADMMIEFIGQEGAKTCEELAGKFGVSTRKVASTLAVVTATGRLARVNQNGKFRYCIPGDNLPADPKAASVAETDGKAFLSQQVLRYRYRKMQHRKILKQKLRRTLRSRCHRLLKRERMTWFYHRCKWQTANCVGRKIMSRSGSESAPRCGS